MFVKNKNMNGVRGNRKEIITLINNIKNENSSLKNENSSLKNENSSLKNENASLKNENSSLKNENASLKNQTDLINKNTLLLRDSNKLLIKNINNSEIITQYKIVIEKLKYENITLKNAYNVTDTISCLDSDDE